MTEKSMDAEGAIATGCQFFADYPIAPAKLRTLAETNLGDKRLIDHAIQIIKESQNISLEDWSKNIEV